jgi:hypothetical protein
LGGKSTQFHSAFTARYPLIQGVIWSSMLTNLEVKGVVGALDHTFILFKLRIVDKNPLWLESHGLALLRKFLDPSALLLLLEWAEFLG